MVKWRVGQKGGSKTRGGKREWVLTKVQVTIPLSKIVDEQLHDEWHNLVPMKPGDPVAGQLHIKIQFTSVITGKHEVLTK